MSEKEQPTQSLPDRVDAWREELSRASLLESEAARSLDSAVVEARAGRIDQPPPPLLTVLLLGATGGGKSALLNALAGDTIARSHHLRPTTSRPTIYMHKDVLPARLFEYGTELGQLAGNAESVKFHSRPELRNKIIIDAPDIDSYRTEHRDLVMRLLPLVDVALYVVTPFSYKDDLGWTTVLRERGRRAFAFVMNKWDAEGMPRVQPGDAGADADFTRLIGEHAGYADARVFLTSARWWSATEAERAELPKPAAGENFAELRQWLEQGLSTSRIEQIQRRRRRSLWGALAGAVAQAMPPKIDVAAARQIATPEIDAMAAEGAAMWRPIIAKRAEALSRRREEEGRPHSPGPFGTLSGLVGGLLNMGRSWKKVTEPQPDATSEEIQETAERSAELTTRRLSGVEWKLREIKIPAEGLSSRGEVFAQDFANRLRAGFETASAQILDRVIQRWRLVTGWVVLVVFELLTVGLIGIAAWRLVLAFISGVYVDLPFTLNLIALVILLLAAGSAFMAILFPPVKTRMRRELETAINRQWRDAADRALVDIDRHLENLVALREVGEAHLKECDGHVQEISREMNAVDDGETGRLFSDGKAENLTQKP